MGNKNTKPIKKANKKKHKLNNLKASPAQRSLKDLPQEENIVETTTKCPTKIPSSHSAFHPWFVRK